MFAFDDTFIDRLIRKEESAYEVFYERTVDVFFRYIKAHYFLDNCEIEDVISEFYLKFWNVLQQYKEKFRFESYVRTVFKSVLVDYLRKQKRIRFVNEEAMRKYEYTKGDMQDLLEQEFCRKDIEQAMQHLCESEKEAVFFRFVEGYSYDEIASLLQVSNNAVRKKISRALQKIRHLCTKCDE